MPEAIRSKLLDRDTSFSQLFKILPHRYPFLMLDKVQSIEPDFSSAIGLKNVTINEPFFQGHFPGIPVMPGVMILEAMAQTAGILHYCKILDLTKDEEEASQATPLFMGADNVRFRAVVRPGDLMFVKATVAKTHINATILTCECEVFTSLEMQKCVTSATVKTNLGKSL